MNMEIPFYYWRIFKIYDMNKNDLIEWRNLVKKSFGKRYVFSDKDVIKSIIVNNRILFHINIICFWLNFTLNGMVIWKFYTQIRLLKSLNI